MDKNNIIILIVIILLFGLGILFWMLQSPVARRPALVPAGDNTPTTVVEGKDTTAAISSDLNAVEVGDVGGDFKDVDSDINGL